ncbi:uncharacterized protein LOC132675739 isoform X1 [Panthera onca]
MGSVAFAWTWKWSQPHPSLRGLEWESAEPPPPQDNRGVLPSRRQEVWSFLVLLKGKKELFGNLWRRESSSCGWSLAWRVWRKGCTEGEGAFRLVGFLRVEAFLIIIGPAHIEHLGVFTWKPGLPAASPILQDLAKPGIAPSRREHKQGWGGERGGPRIRSRLQAPSRQHRAQCGAKTQEPRDPEPPPPPNGARPTRAGVGILGGVGTRGSARSSERPGLGGGGQAASLALVCQPGPARPPAGGAAGSDAARAWRRPGSSSGHSRLGRRRRRSVAAAAVAAAADAVAAAVGPTAAAAAAAAATVAAAATIAAAAAAQPPPPPPPRPGIDVAAPGPGPAGRRCRCS